MGVMDLIDKSNLVCTYCGKQPVVGFTFEVDAEIDAAGETLASAVDQKSIIAVCKEHLPILQEKFEREVKDADIVGELGGDD